MLEVEEIVDMLEEEEEETDQIHLREEIIMDTLEEIMEEDMLEIVEVAVGDMEEDLEVVEVEVITVGMLAELVEVGMWDKLGLPPQRDVEEEIVHIIQAVFHFLIIQILKGEGVMLKLVVADSHKVQVLEEGPIKDQEIKPSNLLGVLLLVALHLAEVVMRIREDWGNLSQHLRDLAIAMVMKRRVLEDIRVGKAHFSNPIIMMMKWKAIQTNLVGVRII